MPGKLAYLRLNHEACAREQVSLPVNSAVLVFELGTPEFLAASRAPDIVSILQDLQENLRLVAKHGVNNPAFDFSEVLESGVTPEAIQSVCHAIRSGIFRASADRNLSLESL